MFVVAVGIAAYTGFRLPNAWTATLDAVSLTDGFHRRIVVGTLLHPLALATGYAYWVFATKSFLVLVALLVVLGVALIQAQLTSQRVSSRWLPCTGCRFAAPSGSSSHRSC
ncbi:MAG: hypothetical protein JWQ81_3380 [Amycolatopsis sp.]|uniref:hypothetical protein n=1 Tax=Amycolatopsis sp. TaxID=37632 RepID=UPI00262EF6BB|nr:hypothetical protein [Amycolatopsis sp.]MCU1682641.1 hypothetical protein [Amycolatopsis sp.]